MVCGLQDGLVDHCAAPQEGAGKQRTEAVRGAVQQRKKEMEPPKPTSRGLEALYGQWRFQDCRLRFNQRPNEHHKSMCKVFTNQYTTGS